MFNLNDLIDKSIESEAENLVFFDSTEDKFSKETAQAVLDEGNVPDDVIMNVITTVTQSAKFAAKGVFDDLEGRALENGMDEDEIFEILDDADIAERILNTWRESTDIEAELMNVQKVKYDVHFLLDRRAEDVHPHEAYDMSAYGVTMDDYVFKHDHGSGDTSLYVEVGDLTLAEAMEINTEGGFVDYAAEGLILHDGGLVEYLGRGGKVVARPGGAKIQ